MDKITRTLILYSSLINGEEINKTLFCFENNCSPRSFDRDIEDIRLFLSETFSLSELKYNRENNTYYIKGAKNQQIEVMEYLFIERILQDTAVLRDDELNILKSHLLMNARDMKKMPNSINNAYDLYRPPKHNKALLKMHGDLELTIRNQKYIRLVYYDDSEIKHSCNVIPCTIRLNSGYLYFVGYIDKSSKATNIRLDRVYSFEILRDLTISEIKKADLYIAFRDDDKLSEREDNLAEIILECESNDYSAICAVFDSTEIINQSDNLLRVKIEVSEEAFNNWYLTNLSSTMTIIQPQSIKTKLVTQAKKIICKYGGED